MLELVQNVVGLVFRIYFAFMAILIDSFLAELGDHFIPICVFFIACIAGVFPLLINFFAQCNDLFRFFTVNSVKKFLVVFNGVAQCPKRDFKLDTGIGR